MEIKDRVAEAIVEKNVVLTTDDAVALGCAFEALRAEVAKADAYDAWRALPYDERSKIDENGKTVNPQPDCSRIPDSFIKDLRKIAKFIDKIAIYPSASNIFD